jgi:hypothetical protein
MISGRTMVRSLVGVGWSGVILFAAAVVNGLLLGDQDPLRLHLFLSLAAHALVLLALLWTLFYFAATGRLVRREARRRERGEALGGRHQRLRRRTLPLATVAVAATVLALLSGLPAYLGADSAVWHHGGVAGAALVLQVAALTLAGRDLQEGERILQALEESSRSPRV